MSLEWQDVVLKDVLSEKGYIRGPFGSALKRSEMKSEGIPVYEQQNAIYNNRSFRYYIDDDKYQSLKRFTTVTDDLIISCSGTVGKVSIIKENDPKGIISQALLTLRVNKELILPEFLKYFFSSYEGYNSLVSRSTGSVQVNISKRAVIEEIPLKLPPLDIQRNIVYYLQLIDAKIENCNSINRNLLSIADAIFKKEFRNFDEYLEGDLISSDFGLIPKNWYYKTLDEISDVAIGKTPPRKETWWFSEKEGVKWVSIKDLGNSGTYIFETSEYLTEEAIDKFNVKLIPEDTVILSFKLTVGRLGITTDEMTTNEAIAHFKLDSESPISKEYLYLYLKNFNYDELGSTSSIAKAINSKIVKKIPILVPESNKLNEFKELFENIFNEIKSNQIEINNLTKLRDTLLPKLMSGEIDVSKINCDMQHISTNNWDNKFTVPLQNNLITVIS